MRRARLLGIGAVAVAVLLAVGWWMFSARRGATRPDSSGEMRTPAPPAAVVVKSAPAPTPALLGERLLGNYGDPARPPEDDLMWVARTLENFALLVKGDNPLPLGANEEIASALRGRNRIGFRALPDQHPAFNAQGQLVDRWGTPLYFHAQSRDQLEIRSAGPDRQMWTADDLHRQPNGRFLRGAALLAPSLFDEPSRSGASAR